MNDLEHRFSLMDRPLALLAIFLMEYLIALHTLWPNYPYLSLVFLWGGTVPLGREARRWTVTLVLGIVLGEMIGYFIAVPWDLTWLCLPRNEYAVSITMFLRLFCVLLALSAWARERQPLTGSSAPPWRVWVADGAGLVVGSC